MIWLPLSFISAFLSASIDALTKHRFSRLRSFEMGAIGIIYTLPWLIAALFFIPWPTCDRMFFLALVCGLPLELLALVCYMRAIKISPLSLTLPFLAFTPLFMIVTGRLILRESLTMPGILGIILIVAGSYFLNFSHIKRGVLSPFNSILREPGSRLMLFVAFIYSLTSSLGKLGVLHSSPPFFGTIYFILLSLIMLFIMPLVPGAKMSSLVSKPFSALLIGALYAVMIFSHMLAISMVQAAYMISIKRTSLLFGVLYGALLFKEERIAERLAGTAIMIGGVFVIGFLG